MNMIPKILIWSEAKPPNEEVRYHHVIAQTPFGMIRIVWNGNRDNDPPSVQRFPGDYRGGCPTTLVAAKIAVQTEWERLLNLCLELDVTDDPAFGPDFVRDQPNHLHDTNIHFQ
jgi:hypothetical protein